MKIAPIVRAIEKDATCGLEYKIVHTGQHYDTSMSQTFFDEFGIPAPHYNLDVRSASHAVQTAHVMIGFEKVCEKEKPDCVVVVGDVNSTAACGLVAKKLWIELAHVEAGLRSRDRTMPEEINRIVTDAIADVLFVTEEDGVKNLLAEGHPRGHVHLVGDVMIDNLHYQLDRLNGTDLPVSTELKARTGGRYAALTMHRPSNVDDKQTLRALLECLNELSAQVPIIFPCHPRTLARIREFGLEKLITRIQDTFTAKSAGSAKDYTKKTHRAPANERLRPGKSRDRAKNYDRAAGPYFKSSIVNRQSSIVPAHHSSLVTSGLIVTRPLGFMEFLNLWKDALCVLTDSGGIQEETTALGVPCITIRENTERPATMTIGSNELVGRDTGKIRAMFRKALAGTWKKCSVPKGWDGKASERIVDILSR